MVADELNDISRDARLAARRFGYTYQANQHPVSQIKDDNVAVAALTAAFLSLDGRPTTEKKSIAQKELQSAMGLSEKDSAELLKLGCWLVAKCGNNDQAFPQLAEQLHNLSGTEKHETLIQIYQGIIAHGSCRLSDKQTRAISDIGKIFPSTSHRGIVSGCQHHSG